MASIVGSAGTEDSAIELGPLYIQSHAACYLKCTYIQLCHTHLWTRTIPRKKLAEDPGGLLAARFRALFPVRPSRPPSLPAASHSPAVPDTADAVRQAGPFARRAKQLLREVPWVKYSCSARLG